jgi:hypothetical protein
MANFTPPTQEDIDLVESEINTPKTSKFTPPTQEELDSIDLESAPTQLEELPIQENPEVEYKAPSGVIAGAATAGALRAAPMGAANLVDKGLLKAATQFGPFAPEELDLVRNNLDQYKTLDPQVTSSKLQESFRDINRSASDLHKQAFANLDQGITPQQFKEMVGSTTPEFSRPLDINDPMIQQEVAKRQEGLASQLEGRNKAASSSQVQNFAAQKAEEAVLRAKNVNLGGMSAEAEEMVRSNVMRNVMANPEAAGFTPKVDAEAMLREYQSMKGASDQVPSQVLSSMEEPLAKTYPQLAGRKLTTAKPSEFTRLQSLLPEGTTPMTGEEFWKTGRTVAEEAYKPNGEISKPVAKAVNARMRDYVTETSPEASELFRQESEQINRLKKLQSEGLLSREAGVAKQASESVVFGEKEAKKLFGELVSGKTPLTQEVANKIAVLKENIDPRLFDELRLAAIKAMEADPSKALNIKPFEAAMGVASGASLPTAVYAGSKYSKTAGGAMTMATAIPKMLDAIPDSVKTVGRVTGKVLGTALPILGAGAGAYAGYQEAEEAGFDPWAKGLYSAAEAINPLPISGIQAYKGMEKAAEGRRSNIEQNFKAADMLSNKKPKTEDIKFTSTDGAEMTQMADAMEASGGKAAQEYSRVIRQVISSPDSKKEAVLFTLNQQPAFRALVKKMKEGQ